MQLFEESRIRNNEIFWGEIEPAEHLVHFYSDNERFLDTLEGFISAGLRNGECVVVIVTSVNRRALNRRLNQFWTAEILQERFICLNTEETIPRFMRDGWPDQELFTGAVTELLQHARKDGRRVRAFGEMVAVLWNEGYHQATVRLEHLWHELCKSEVFSLFCAYPKSSSHPHSATSIKTICEAHSKTVQEMDWLNLR